MLGWLEGRGAKKAQEYEEEYLKKLEKERQAAENLVRHHDEIISPIITKPGPESESEPARKKPPKKTDEGKQIGTGTAVALALFFMFFISMNLVILLEAVPIDISDKAQDTNESATTNTSNEPGTNTENRNSIQTVTYQSYSGIFLANILNYSGNETQFLEQKPKEIDVNTHLTLIVILGGALGAKLHGLATLRKVLAENRDKLFKKHILWYLMRPFSGAVIALVFYFAIRGGVLTTTGVDILNPYGLVTIGIVVGLAEEKALSKIKALIDVLFGQEGRKSEEQESLKILNIRLAKGEITTEEYEKLKKQLGKGL